MGKVLSFDIGFLNPLLEIYFEQHVDKLKGENNDKFQR